MKIKLTGAEFWAAAQVGMVRQYQSVINGLKDQHGASADGGWNLHIEGACGEAAVAKALNQFWCGSVNTFKVGGDIGNKIQVRTRSKSYYELIVRNDDRDDDIFVLVTGISPSFDVVGWIIGKDAKKKEWIQTHGGREAAYFVPHKELKDINQLINNKLNDTRV